MLSEKDRPERARALVLLQKDAEPEEVAEVAALLHNELGFIGEDDWVVVRADVVAGYKHHYTVPYNIVVPVDAKNEDGLDYAIEQIMEKAGVNEVAVLRVDLHRPDPPHAAHSFVTPAESEARPDHSVEVGRRKFKSPAENAWG